MNRFWILKNSNATPCFSPRPQAWNLITQADNLYDMTRTSRWPSGDPAPLRGRNNLLAVMDDHSFTEFNAVFNNCSYNIENL
jgi:hypothetical protein